jgi:transcription antitermination factor NusA-like protein
LPKNQKLTADNTDQNIAKIAEHCQKIQIEVIEGVSDPAERVSGSLQPKS